jgi:DNA-binding HxlR family transcriptional regulator
MRLTLNVIGGKWKPVILYHLMQGRKRYGELQRLLPDVTQKMLTQHLRELTRDGIIIRKVYPTVPPGVEYSFGEAGESLRPALRALCRWGKARRKKMKANASA